MNTENSIPSEPQKLVLAAKIRFKKFVLTCCSSKIVYLL